MQISAIMGFFVCLFNDPKLFQMMIAFIVTCVVRFITMLHLFIIFAQKLVFISEILCAVI